MTNQIKPEIWRTIKDFPDYAVSTNGRVKRIKATKKNSYVGRILKPYLSGRKYLRVLLSSPKYKKHKAIQHLVLETFISPRPESKECNHKDGNKSNNCVENLEWVTSSENSIHAYKAGLSFIPKGEQCHWSKLTKSKVLKIRDMYKNGNYSYRQLAKTYNVNFSTIGKIVNRVTWKHI